MPPGETIYDAKMVMTGEHTGEMDVHVVYLHSGIDDAVNIREKSRGFVQYDGERIEIAEMLQV